MKIAAFAAGLLLLVCPTVSDAGNLRHKHLSGRINVVSTTGITNDIVSNVGGNMVAAKSLMGPGVDPHLYKATAGDIRTLAEADVIFHHGLHLEGKISDILESMKSRGINTVAVTRDIPESKLIPIGKTANYDPHVWLDPELWGFAVQAVSRTLSGLDPANAPFYRKNARAYMSALRELDNYAKKMFSKIAEDKKILVTSHDAFGYFGKAYGFKVTALQSVSTASEAGISDVRKVVEVITANRLPAIFTESSVSPRYIRAVKKAVESSGMSVAIGGELFSDALGSRESRQGTFYGMFKHNVDVIFLSLSGSSARELAAIRKEKKSGEHR